MVRDEKFARMFAAANIPSEADLSKQMEAATQAFYDYRQMEAPTRAFYDYANGSIAKYGEALQTIQGYYRGETSGFSVRPELIAALRNFFMLQLGEISDSAIGNQHDRNAAIQGRTRFTFNQPSLDIVDDVAKLFPRFETKIRENKYVVEYLTKHEKHDERLAHEPFPTAVDSDLSWNTDNTYGYFGYFALTVALAEYAAGNCSGREGQRDIGES